MLYFEKINGIMPRTHGANKSILFAQILDPYEVTLREFAQIKNGFFAHVYRALSSSIGPGKENDDNCKNWLFLLVLQKQPKLIKNKLP